MTGIMCMMVGGGDGVPAFTAVFNNAEDINIGDQGQSGFVYQATYTINTNATCAKLGPDFSLGPTAWGTPTGGSPGNSFEARLNVTEFNAASGGYARFAGVNITSTGLTSWFSLSSNRAIDMLSSTTDLSFATGTLFIRNTASLVEISRAFQVYADPTF